MQIWPPKVGILAYLQLWRRPSAWERLEIGLTQNLGPSKHLSKVDILGVFSGSTRVPTRKPLYPAFFRAAVGLPTPWSVTLWSQNRCCLSPIPYHQCPIPCRASPRLPPHLLVVKAMVDGPGKEVVKMTACFAFRSGTSDSGTNSRATNPGGPQSLSGENEQTKCYWTLVCCFDG